MHRLPPLIAAALDRYTWGRAAEALPLLHRALALAPASPDALHVAGLCVLAQGGYAAAVRLTGRAVRSAAERAGPILPNHATALAALGASLFRARETADAEAAWRRATAAAPQRAENWRGLGEACLAVRGPSDAEPVLARALALSPHDPDAYLILGNAALAAGDSGRAERCYARALTLFPEHATAASNLTVARLRGERLGAAVTAGWRAVALRPDLAEAWVNLGSALVQAGRPEDATHASRRALALRPTYVEAHSNLLMALQYLDVEPLALVAEHRRFDAAHGRPRVAHHRRHDNAPIPERRLRVGYVSSDFRQHVASCFFEPLLAAHDPARIEAICYSDTTSPDAVTRRLTALAGGWRTTSGLGEAALAEAIRADRIDVLVDLAGHSSGNRQTVFARRPAPVQVTWLGYPDTTGLSAMDFRLVDAITDPEGAADGLASEALIRLPRGFLCYRPPRGAPEPGPLPAASGPVTFGSFNQLAKLTPGVARLWAEVLRRVPEGRLLLKTRGLADPAVRRHALTLLEAHGVPAGRVDCVAWAPTWRDHLALYDRVDIALDSFPYNGTTTTCEALWMGVPVVTLAGRRHAARVGASLLARVGLADLVADDPEGYVAAAARLAADQERLTALRLGLRARLRASPLCDAPGFARQVEEAYRAVWRRWCAARHSEDADRL